MTTSDRVPREFPIGINGTPFQLDETSNAFTLGSIPVLQRLPYAQSDAATTDPSARTSRFTDWSHGAGQTFWDDPASDQARFRQSKGVDPWTPGKLSVLNGTSNIQSASTGYSYMAAYQSVAGDSIYPKVSVYYLDTVTGTKTFRRIVLNNDDTINSGPTNLTGFAGTHGGAAPRRCVASSGTWSVYFVDGNTGVRYAANGNTATSPLATLSALTSINGIGVAKGHVLAWGGAGFLFVDATPGGTISTATFSINASVGEIVDIADGSNVIFISGNLDGRAVIYSVAADPSTTALTNLKRAAVLPFGETIYCTYGYLGLLFIGTNKGFRCCAELNDGTLQVGSLVNIGKPVRVFNGLGQYVYFGWSNYDGSDGGLGRIDPSTFVEGGALTPAYASDIMAVSDTGDILDLLIFDNSAGTIKPYFNTSTKFYRQTSTPVTSATIDLGFTSYNLTEPKTAVGVDLRTETLPANSSVAVSLTNVSGGSPTSISTYSTTSGTGTLMTVPNIVGSEHEIRLTLATTGSAPVVTATTLQATPRPSGRGELWKIPVQIGTDISDNNGNNQKFDPFTIIAMLRAAASSTDPVDVQIGTYSDTMLVEDFEFHGYSWLIEGAPAMTGLITLKNLSA